MRMEYEQLNKIIEIISLIEKRLERIEMVTKDIELNTRRE